VRDRAVALWQGVRVTSDPGVVSVEDDKRAAATYAAGLVEDGMRVGLGSGTTAAYLVPALAARGLRVRCVATSEVIAAAARAAGLVLEELDTLGALDIGALQGEFVQFAAGLGVILLLFLIGLEYTAEELSAQLRRFRRAGLLDARPTQHLAVAPVNR